MILLVKDTYFLESVYESISEGVCLHEIVYNERGYPIDCRIIDFNSAYKNLTGLHQDEVSGKLVSDVFDMEYSSSISTYSKMAETGEIDYFDTYISSIGRYVRMSIKLLEKGKIITILTDITNQKKTNKELKTISENTPVILMLIDSSRKVIKVNKNAETFAGSTSEDMVGLKSGDAIRCLGSMDNPNGCGFGSYCSECKVRYTVTDTLKTGQNHYNVEATIPFLVDNCKKYLTFLISTSIINPDNDSQIIVSFLDITERKQIENRLKESEKRFKSLVEQAADAIIAHDFDGNINYVNELACECLGYSNEELLSMNIVDINPNLEDIRKLKEEYWEKLSSDTSYLIETRHKCKNGHTYPVEVKMTRIELDGKPVILGFSRDITVRKKAEDNLIDAKLEAEAANKAKSDLMTSVSHELRTPLTSIIGFSDVMLKGKPGDLTDNQRSYLYKIYRSGKKLLDIINDIIDLSEIESGISKLKWEHIPITTFMEDIKKDVYQLIIDKDIDFYMEIESSINYIYADKLKFKQILHNLLHNAVKFTESGSITVNIKQTADGYQFSVIDTGIGIPENKKNDIFDSFKQLDSGLNRKYQGTGLGLTLVKRLVDLHEGDIWVESEPNNGSIFTFKIPVHTNSIQS